MANDGEPQLDLTRSPLSAPLPLPITVSNRSTRPRRQQSTSSSAASATHSRSQSLAVTSQLLYPGDYDYQEQRQSSSRGNSAHSEPHQGIGAGGIGGRSVSEDPDGNIGRRECSSGRAKRRRRSTTPFAGSSTDIGRKRRRRSVSQDPDATPANLNEADAAQSGLRNAHGPQASPATTISAGRQMSLTPNLPSPDPSETAPEEGGSRKVSESAEVDPLDAYNRMMDQNASSSSSACNATAAALLNVRTLNVEGVRPHILPFLDATFIAATTTTTAASDTSPPDASPVRTLSPCPSPRSATHPSPRMKEKRKQSHEPEAVPIQTVEPLAAHTCPVCFSPPSYATITPCGHVLCGECLFTAVKTTIQRGAYTLPPGERMVARCPVCRAPIPEWDGKGGGVIGLRPRAVFSL